MKKFNLSKIMNRAWELVKKTAMTMSSALKQAWKEAKEKMEDILETVKSNLEEMAYNNYNINAGIDRKISVKPWEKDGAKRAYLAINCYTANGRFKGSYKCGYVDLITSQYVIGKYDEVDAINKLYIGR